MRKPISMRVLDEGTGPPVVLLHGFPDRAELWRHVAADLRAAGNRTIVPDLRGFGESPAPARRGDYAIDNVVGDIEQMLDSLGIREPVDVIGHDWGAMTSWALCLSRPERVRRHVAVSVGHPLAFVRAGLEQKRRSTYMVVWQIPRLPEHALSESGFRRLRVFSRHPDIEQVVSDLSRPGRLTAGLNWYRANLLPAVGRRWPRCRVPTLGVWSDRDRFLAEPQMLASARYMDALWRYERIEGAGHWIPLDDPKALSAPIIDWLAAPDTAA